MLVAILFGLIVLSAGYAVLRALDGEAREIGPGDVIACPTGPRGAHRIDNRGDAPVRFLVVSTMIAPEVNEYPDSGKVWMRSYPPGGSAGADDPGLDVLIRRGEQVDYLDGES